MQVLNKLLGFGIGVLFLSGGILYLYQHKDTLFRLQEIRIEAQDGTANSYLFNKIKGDLSTYTASYIGRSLWDVGLNDLMRDVEKDGRVAEVSIRRKFPNRIELKIKPHKPGALLLNAKSELFPVALDGSLLPKVKSSEALDLPILRGKSFEQDKEKRALAVQTLRKLPNNKYFNEKMVSEIFFDDKDGISLLLQPEAHLLRLGSDQLSDKISKVDRVLNYLAKEDLNGRVIDARFSKKVVVKLRNAP